jgi:hypothetical protein
LFVLELCQCIACRIRDVFESIGTELNAAVPSHNANHNIVQLEAVEEEQNGSPAPVSPSSSRPHSATGLPDQHTMRRIAHTTIDSLQKPDKRTCIARRL